MSDRDPIAATTSEIVDLTREYASLVASNLDPQEDNFRREVRDLVAAVRQEVRFQLEVGPHLATAKDTESAIEEMAALPVREIEALRENQKTPAEERVLVAAISVKQSFEDAKRAGWTDGPYRAWNAAHDELDAATKALRAEREGGGSDA